MPVRQAGGDDHDEIAMPLFQCNFVKTKGAQAGKLRPIDLRGDAPFNHPQDYIIGQMFLETDVIDSRVDQLAQQVRIKKGRLGAIGLMPLQDLGGGGFALAGLAPVTFWAIAQIDRAS